MKKKVEPAPEDQVYNVLKLAFPDLPKDFHLVMVNENPHYLGTTGTFYAEPARVDLKPYKVEKGDAAYEFTAGVYEPEGASEVYCFVLTVRVEGVDGVYKVTTNANAKTTPPA